MFDNRTRTVRARYLLFPASHLLGLTEGLQWVLQSAVRRLTASVTSRVTSNMTVLWTNWCGFTLS